MHIILDGLISHYLLKRKQPTKNPKGGLVSLEELQESVEDEEELSGEIKQHLIKEENPFAEIPTERIQNALGKLEIEDRRLADILRKRYLEDKTLQQIASEQGLSRQRIEVLEKKGLRILRSMILFPK